MNEVRLVALTREHSVRLAMFISTDEALHQALSPGQPQSIVDAHDYYKTCLRWAERKKGRCYAITLCGLAIGSMSLCDINLHAQTASVGYWIATEYQGKGYATLAFDQVIGEAQALGIRTLSCSIDPGNTASLALWKRKGAGTVECEGAIRPLLHI